MRPGYGSRSRSAGLRRRATQPPQIDLSIGDRREPEAVPRRGGDPVAEPLAADGEGEPSEAYGAVLMVGVQIFGEFGGAMDRLDDDVFRATPLPPRP